MGNTGVYPTVSLTVPATSSTGTFNATVNLTGTTYAPTGQVFVQDTTGAVVGLVVLPDGVISLPLSIPVILNQGATTLTATYNGDDQNQAATSAPSTVTVGTIARTTPTLTFSVTSTAVSRAMVSGSVKLITTSSPAPTGSITIYATAAGGNTANAMATVAAAQALVSSGANFSFTAGAAGPQLHFDLDPMLQEVPGSVPVRVFILKHALKYLDTMSQESISDHELEREVGNGYIRVGQIQADQAAPSMNDRAGAWDSMSRGFAVDKRLSEKDPGDLKSRGLLVRQAYLMGFLALDDGDLARSEQITRQAWELGQPLLAAGPKAPRFATMIDLAWALANNRADNGGSWSFADPAAAFPWLDKMIELSDRYHGAFPADAKNKAGAAETLGREALARPARLSNSTVMRRLVLPMNWR